MRQQPHPSAGVITPVMHAAMLCLRSDTIRGATPASTCETDAPVPPSSEMPFSSGPPTTPAMLISRIAEAGVTVNSTVCACPKPAACTRSSPVTCAAPHVTAVRHHTACAGAGCGRVQQSDSGITRLLRVLVHLVGKVSTGALELLTLLQPVCRSLHTYRECACNICLRC